MAEHITLTETPELLKSADFSGYTLDAVSVEVVVQKQLDARLLAHLNQGELDGVDVQPFLAHRDQPRGLQAAQAAA